VLNAPIPGQLRNNSNFDGRRRMEAATVHKLEQIGESKADEKVTLENMKGKVNNLLVLGLDAVGDIQTRN
jgi:propanediol utilization protein